MQRELQLQHHMKQVRLLWGLSGVQTDSGRSVPALVDLFLCSTGNMSRMGTGRAVVHAVCQPA